MSSYGVDLQKGHRLRLRERFQKSAVDGFHDYEVLELLLTYSIPRRDVKPIAKRLIQRFGSLQAVFEAGEKELASAAGLGKGSAALIRLVKEIHVLISRRGMEKKNALTNPQMVVNYAINKLAGFSHEAFMVIFLNTQNEILSDNVLNEGTVDQVAVYPRRIVELALSHKAAGLILVHNHPSGHVNPSEEDKNLTRQVKTAAQLLDIHVLDHIIVGKGGYFSFREGGLI